MTCCVFKKSREEYTRQARVHRALANPARLMMVDCLRQCEVSVGDLAAGVGLDISTISKHLSVLLEAGIVENRKDGLSVLYRLRTPCVLDVFACTEAVLCCGEK